MRSTSTRYIIIGRQANYVQQLGHLHRFMQQPVLNVIGMLGAAGATKIGYAGLAGEAIMTCVVIY